MKWLLFFVLMLYLDVPMWMVILWSVSFLVDGLVWIIRGC